MVVRFRSWWQQIKTHPGATVLIALFVTLVVLVILGGYKFNWDWTGFNRDNKSSKTLWDWMQLLFIPVVLAVAGFWFNHRERKAAELRADNERKAAELRAEAERFIAEDNQREAALQAYINNMSELLLHENLRESQPEDEVCKIARVRTLTGLQRSDGERKRSVLEFLYEAGLIVKGQPIIDLCWADFRGVNLCGGILHKAALGGANLCEATLWKADLSEADLSVGDLRKADLREADLSRADLSNADLREAYLNGADMHEGDLYGAKLNDAKLNRVHLNNADLSFARMIRANLQGAWLDEANLEGTNLENADLRNADLRKADLSKAFLEGANLEGAKVTTEQLEKAKSLQGATMPNGSIHPSS
jgi:uncharacterized protein YjbI with pentapeptide repeats